MKTTIILKKSFMKKVDKQIEKTVKEIEKLEKLSKSIGDYIIVKNGK